MGGPALTNFVPRGSCFSCRYGANLDGHGMLHIHQWLPGYRRRLRRLEIPPA